MLDDKNTRKKCNRKLKEKNGQNILNGVSEEIVSFVSMMHVSGSRK